MQKIVLVLALPITIVGSNFAHEYEKKSRLSKVYAQSLKKEKARRGRLPRPVSCCSADAVSFVRSSEIARGGPRTGRSAAAIAGQSEDVKMRSWKETASFTTAA